jgi:hypothetical protein
MRTHRVPPASQLPALAAFARGYLHQDLIAEYGSAAGAAAAFAADAAGDERQDLIENLERLAAALDGKSASQVSRYFTEELRAAWAPDSAADVRALIAALEP